jgi:SAM-dependent methyltransferase
MQISRYQQFLGVLHEAGFRIAPQTRIMDFGCGAGNLVMDFVKAGYDAFGCDLAFKEGANVGLLSSEGRIRLIDRHSNRLPFDDGMFDAVISDQVFEHVKNYGTALQEICRILKPNGVCVHFFPSRYMPIEPHVHVPFATLVQNYWWLRFWAELGVRKSTQRGLEAPLVADENHSYLKTSTNYLPKKKINQEFSRFFNKVEFAEKFFLKYSRGGQAAYKLSSVVTFVPALYSALGNRVIVASEPVLR